MKTKDDTRVDGHGSSEAAGSTAPTTEKAASFTPGPWSLADDCTVVGSNDEVVVAVDLPEFISEADKRLIAAAPDLYTVLAAIQFGYGGFGKCPWCLGWDTTNGETEKRHTADCLVAKALAKAEGR